MIKEFVDLFNRRRSELERAFRENEPTKYVDVVRETARILNPDPNAYSSRHPDPSRVIEIDDGCYQGDYLYILPASHGSGKFWCVAVEYGSCAACDTLEAAQELDDVDERIREYMMLALHIVQGLKELPL